MLEGISLVNLTASGLLGIVVLMILFDRLISRKRYEEKCQESERWQKAYETERDTRKVSDAQTAQLLEYAIVSHEILEAMFGATEPPRKGGAHRVVQTSN